MAKKEAAIKAEQKNEVAKKKKQSQLYKVKNYQIQHQIM